MEKIKSAVDGLIASRKGLLALIGTLAILAFLLITTTGFIVDWALGSKLMEFQFVKDVYVGGFQWLSGIVAAYSAANLCNKFIDKKKDENKGRRR